MGDILTIKDKILAFLKEKDIKKVDFFEATGIQSSNFKGKNMASQPGGYTIHQEISQDNKQEIEKYNAPPEIVDKLLSTIKEQAEEIGMLKQTITQLKQDKSGRVSDASDSTVANAI